MEFWNIFCLCFIIQGLLAFENSEDNEFAEFEDFDESDSNFIEEERIDQKGSEKDKFVPLSREKEADKSVQVESDEEVS